VNLPNQITPLILTYNEAPNIKRTLEKLAWAKQIVVVDSFSTDDTVAICQRHPQVELVQRKFEDHASQWNFGLAQIKTEWVLSLDADYLLSDAFVQELRDWTPSDGVNAYSAPFKYCVQGRLLRASLYPPRPVLFRPERCRYTQNGHTQKLQIEGATGRLSQFIHHDDRKPLERWFQEQNHYARLEAQHLLAASNGKLNLPDRLRRSIVVAPGLVFLYTLFAKGLILDGWPGWYYVAQRTLAELMLSMRLIEKKLKAEN